jgi:hypothetical protein
MGCLQGGNSTGASRYFLIQQSDLGFHLELEVEKHGQHHDDASKEVMASTDVTIINSLRDYALAQLPTPKHLFCKELQFWKTLMIGELGIPSSE